MLRICPEIYFEIAPTVSTLNIFNLPKLHQELVNLNLLETNKIYLNFLERPMEYNLKSLSENKKTEVNTVILNHIKCLLIDNTSLITINQFKNILSYLN